MDSLQNHFLVAMPSLQDSFFERTVIYICEHDSKGAMGLIINRPLGVAVNQIMQQLEYQPSNIEYPELFEQDVLVGGPVNPERGFVLHSPQPYWSNSLALSDDLMLTTSKDILTAIGSKQSPQKLIVALGYAGWSQNQLEQELAENSWLTIPADTNIMFETPIEHRWEQATRSLGFDFWQMSSQIGHA